MEVEANGHYCRLSSNAVNLAQDTLLISILISLS